ncbi:hypothetical protein PSTG_13312 [Puccinia striiformis f. sp. tritici PST-78]|uniref:Uncharacterized protein n=1 Tax=Puccinia striiformis f. sp. tritici PST-78 TaxID=1165861 RepID=A0A0L0V2F2_9BASI|nr:hypothetical protein PSTG_13312 [Puccinia striiformis f. sp. tritici PST-78]
MQVLNLPIVVKTSPNPELSASESPKYEEKGLLPIVINKTPKMQMEVKTSFKLHVASKNTKKAKIWVPIKTKKEFVVMIVVGKTTFTKFQKLVATNCDIGFKNASTIVNKALTKRKLELNWYVSIMCVPVWELLWDWWQFIEGEITE